MDRRRRKKCSIFPRARKNKTITSLCALLCNSFIENHVFPFTHKLNSLNISVLYHSVSKAFLLSRNATYTVCSKHKDEVIKPRLFLKSLLKRVRERSKPYFECLYPIEHDPFKYFHQTG